MRRSILGGLLLALAPACLLISPLDEATPIDGYGGGAGSSSKAGSGNAGKGGSSNTGGASGGLPPAAGGANPAGGSGGSGGSPEPQHVCNNPLLIDDMEAPSHTTNLCASDRTGGWFVFHDMTAETVPPRSGDPGTGAPFPYTALDTPRAGSTYAARVQGSGFTDYGGGLGVSMRFPDAPYNASPYSGVTFWARGTGTIQVAVPTMDTQENIYGGRCVPQSGLICGDHFRSALIALSSAWTPYTVTFASLAQEGFGIPVPGFNANEMMAVHFVWGAFTTFDIWVDDLAFVAGSPTCNPNVVTCPTPSSVSGCVNGVEQTLTCVDFCNGLGFDIGTNTCTPGEGCACGYPLDPTCDAGAAAICGCYGECSDLQLDNYIGCFLGEAGYDWVYCAGTYVDCVTIDAYCL